MTYMRHCFTSRPALAYGGAAWAAGHRAGRRYETRQHGRYGRGGDFGVRRPLRYLRYHLDLDDSQSRRMAAVLNRLKLEREQAQVDEKRSVQAVAGLLSEAVTDRAALQDALKEALSPRVTTAQHLQAEVARALQEICEILDDDQRNQFADLVASGAIAL